MIDPQNPLVIDTVKAWTGREAKNERVLQVTPSTVRLDAALMNDAVWLFAKATRELHYAQNITMIPQDCNSKDTWVLGSSLNNYMKHVSFITHIIFSMVFLFCNAIILGIRNENRLFLDRNQRNDGPGKNSQRRRS